MPGPPVWRLQVHQSLLPSLLHLLCPGQQCRSLAWVQRGDPGGWHVALGASVGTGSHGLTQPGLCCCGKVAVPVPTGCCSHSPCPRAVARLPAGSLRVAALLQAQSLDIYLLSPNASLAVLM